MDDEREFELATKVLIPDNTFAIFVHLDSETQTLQVEVADYVSENLRGTKEYDGMGLIINELGVAIEEALQRFANLDPDFTIEQDIKVELEDGENVIPFPDLNTRH